MKVALFFEFTEVGIKLQCDWKTSTVLHGAQKQVLWFDPLQRTIFTMWMTWTVMKWKIFGEVTSLALTRGAAAGVWSKVTLHHTSCRNRMFSRISTSWACSKANSHQNYEAVSQHAKTWTTFHGQKVCNSKTLLNNLCYYYPNHLALPSTSAPK